MRDDTPTGQRSSGTKTVEVPKDEYDELVELAKVGQLVEVRSEGDDPTLEDIWLAGQPVGKIIESNRKKADNATKEVREAGSADAKGGVDGSETGSDDSEMLPIERIAEAENREDATMGHVTASVERAVTLFKNFGKWSKKAPKGRVVKNNLKNLLATATGEDLAWKQVYRACRKLEEWSKGKIQFVQHDRFGWILVERSSSARTG